MCKQLGLLLLLVHLGLSSNFLFGQRGGANPTVEVVPTITHATCFNPKGTFDFEVVVSSHWSNEAKMNSWKLENSIPEVVDQSDDPDLIGTVNNLGVGVYTFSGSVTALNSSGMWVSVPFSLTIWMGIETVWTEKIDMIAAPNSYSAKRNATTLAYGGVRSSNGITSGDGWIEMSAVFGSTSDNRVFWLIGDTNPLGIFSPNSQIQFIEFFKGSAGNGIRIKYEAAGGGYLYSTLSTDENDKIRLVRVGSTLTIQKNSTSSALFTLPISYSGAMNIVVHTLAQDDGCYDVVSTFACRLDKSFISHAEVKRKLDGGHTLAVENGLKFTFDGEYEVSNGVYISYNIYDKDHDIKGSSDSQGTVSSGATALAYSYDDNRYSLDLSGMNLTPEEFYTLEIIDSKGAKKYLKFLFKD